MKSNNPYVFISYSTINKDTADLVKIELNKHDISCWMAPYSIPFGSDYSTEIFDAIANCKVFVLILSKDAMNSGYVSKELDLAVANCKIVIPFQIDNEQLKKNFAFYLCNVQIIHAASSISESLQSMIDFIISVSTNYSSYKKSTIYPMQRFQSPVKSLVGRETYLELLNELFEDNMVVSVSGIGGIGKTELVRLFIKHKLDNKEIDLVSYNDYTENLRLTISIMQFDNFDEEQYLSQKSQDGSKYDITEVLYRKKLSMLQRCDERLLLVIDGCDNYNDKDIEILKTLKCKTLITTRCNFNTFPQLKLDNFSNDDQRKIFISYYDDYDDTNQEDNIYIDKILKLVDYHTLTIMLLSTFLNVSGLSIKELYAELTSTTRLNLSFYDEIEYEHNYGAILQHISNLFAVSSLTDEEIQILYELSVLPSIGISKKIFRNWNKEGAMTLVDKLIKKGWIQSDRGIINLHPIINTMLDNRRPKTIEYMKDFLINAAEYLEVSSINGLKNRSEAELIAYSIADSLEEKSEMACYLLLLCGRYIDDYNYWRLYGAQDTYNYSYLYQVFNNNNEGIIQLEKAYAYLKKAIEMYEELGLENLGLLSRTYTNIGNTCLNMNKIEEAISYYELSLVGRKKDFYNSHEKVVTTRRRLGNCHLRINKPEIALKYFKENLDAVTESNAKDRIIIAKCWFDCGRTYHFCGDEESALNCYNQVLDYINDLREFDLFACAHICYEIAKFILETDKNLNLKSQDLLLYGKKCLQSLNSKMANSLNNDIDNLLISHGF